MRWRSRPSAPPSSLVALGCGLVWSASRSITGSLVPALVAHLIWDIAVLLWRPLDSIR